MFFVGPFVCVCVCVSSYYCCRCWGGAGTGLELFVVTSGRRCCHSQGSREKSCVAKKN